MKFYHDKLKQIRKQKKIKVYELANKIDVNRNTLWLWEANRYQPSEKMVRGLAEALDIPVTQISDLETEIPLSDVVKPSHVSALLYSFSCANMSARKRYQKHHLKIIETQFDELNQIATVIDTFLKNQILRELPV